MIKAGLFLSLLLASNSLIAAGFSNGDQIELSKDTPLYFKETTLVRVGKAGERFAVLLAQPEQHRLYVSARDALGKEVALSLSDDAVQSPKELTDVEGKIPATMAARINIGTRAKAMQLNGGTPASDEAVLRGLRWLVQTQNADGSWAKGGNAVVSAMTGFAILSFLGHGETPASVEFGPTVQKALDWVTATGGKSDGHLSMESKFTQQGVYAHGIVTCALGEYYTMTRDERVVDLLKKAVGYIVDGQGPDGGWMYAYDKTESDTSVSGWQIQALRAAHLSGLNIDGVDASLDKAMLNLKRVQGKHGGFGYRNAANEKYSLTGVGVMCTYSWKQEKDLTVRSGIEYILQLTKDAYPVAYKGDKADLYAWYYNTQACFMVGGSAWDTWNRMFQNELVKNQGPDGSWPSMPGRAVGDFQQTDEGIGPFYRTNFCILMLEVYYRYLPIAVR